MKMKVFRMLLVCFFQELLSSSSLRPISSRVEEGRAAGKRRGRGDWYGRKDRTAQELAGFRMLRMVFAWCEESDFSSM